MTAAPKNHNAGTKKEINMHEIFQGTKIVPIHKDVIVSDMYFGETITKAGLILFSDDKKDDGIRPRWAKVYATGPKQKDVRVGQWVLISHGRWTRGFKFQNSDTREELVLRKVDTKDLLMVSDEEPRDR
jgi:hypothetical protein